MPNDPLGISFSPFGQDQNASGPGGPRGASPQEAVRILSLRTPRTVGAASPIPSPLMNAPGGASFGPAGANLEQLLAILFGQGRILPGGGTFNERPPQGMLGGPQLSQPMPWDQGGAPWDQVSPAFAGKAPAPSVRPGAEEPRSNMPQPGNGTATGPMASGPALPWEDRNRRI